MYDYSYRFCEAFHVETNFHAALQVSRGKEFADPLVLLRQRSARIALGGLLYAAGNLHTTSS